jgi:hypothetical protein
MSTIDGSLMDQIRICMTHALSFVVQMSVIVVVSPLFIPPAILIIAAYVYYSLMVGQSSVSSGLFENGSLDDFFLPTVRQN